MFDRIAGVYDVMNSVMTAGLHHRWRERAVDLARVGAGLAGARRGDRNRRPGDRAGGARRRRRRLGLLGGHARARPREERRRAWEHGNALALPYPDDSFDAATVGFGARNFSDLAQGLREMTRVVRPGGRVVVLEITTPTRPPLSTFFSLWFDRIVPLLGRVTGEDQAYTYLPSSVKRFPGPRELGAVMHDAGLRDVRWILTAGGIIALHSGTVDGER